MSLSLADAIFWVAVACCAIGQVAIVRSAVQSGDRRATDVAWAVLPGFALAAVLVFTWSAMHTHVISAVVK